MTHKVVFGRRAQADLARLFDYLEPRAGEKTARAFVDKIYVYCLGFEVFPERGMRRDDIRNGMRLVGFRRNASIAFTVDDTRVIIVRIFIRGEEINGDL
jgi:toxin ParE1/3/4